MPSLPAAYLSAQKRVKDVEAKSDGGKKKKEVTDAESIPNATQKTNMLALGAKVGVIRKFLTKIGPDAPKPQDSQGKEICLSWHLASTGYCMTSCTKLRRNPNAHKGLSASDEQSGLQTSRHKATNNFEQFGWHETCRRMRSRSDITEDIGSLPHRAAPLHGAPVILNSEPWRIELIEKRFRRGPHRSALEYADCLQDEFLDFIRKGFWMLLPYEEVKDLPGLRLSPLGVVPRRERRPRIFVDYSFYGINGDTVPLAPIEAMQFGKANERRWSKILHAHPRFGPVHMYKLDISGGFYRVHLTTSGVLKKLGV